MLEYQAPSLERYTLNTGVEILAAVQLFLSTDTNALEMFDANSIVFHKIQNLLQVTLFNPNLLEFE